jgi:Uma2 family endonuclease
MSDVLEKLNEYATLGTPHIWLIDPRLNRLFTFHGNCLAEAETVLSTTDPCLELTAAEIFAQ